MFQALLQKCDLILLSSVFLKAMLEWTYAVGAAEWIRNFYRENKACFPFLYKNKTSKFIMADLFPDTIHQILLPCCTHRSIQLSANLFSELIQHNVFSSVFSYLTEKVSFWIAWVTVNSFSLFYSWDNLLN